MLVSVLWQEAGCFPRMHGMSVHAACRTAPPVGIEPTTSLLLDSCAALHGLRRSTASETLIRLSVPPVEFRFSSEPSLYIIEPTSSLQGGGRNDLDVIIQNALFHSRRVYPRRSSSDGCLEVVPPPDVDWLRNPSPSHCSLM